VAGKETMDFQEFAFEVIDRLARLEEGVKGLGTIAEIIALKERVDGIEDELKWYRRGVIGGLIVLAGWTIKALLKL